MRRLTIWLVLPVLFSLTSTAHAQGPASSATPPSAPPPHPMHGGGAAAPPGGHMAGLPTAAPADVASPDAVLAASY